MPDAILTINAGSSSIKFALFEANATLERMASGEVEGIGGAPHFFVRDADGTMLHEKRWAHGEELTHEELLSPLLDWVEQHLGDAKLIAAGHRIVHGGEKFVEPIRVDANVLLELSKLNTLAPLHEIHNLSAVKAVMALRKNLPQIGCFDTAFHHEMPVIATRLAIPRHFHDEGVRRYGFHGLSYEYISGRMREIAPPLASAKVIAAHLGNGASVCAMQNGKSIDSSMGFTALDGLVMGTRCGTIDPGVLLYFMQARGMSAEAISDLLYKKSGLLGVSGISADVRDLLASEDPAAAEAVALFVFHAARQISALIASLGGLDGLIFTAGIGEHAAPVRTAICARLSWLGISLDEAANIKNAGIISTPSSKIEVHIIPTDEEAMIAKHCLEVIQKNSSFL
jgi:acetate kinase